MQFFALSGGGLLLGLAVAWVIGRFACHLARFCIGDPTIQTVISILTPYAAYLAAEAMGLGSILAVVAAGLYAGVDDTRHLDAPTRAHAWEVWRMLTYAFNGLVFLLLGVQLHSVIAGIPHASVVGLLLLALAIATLVIVLRIVWVFPAAYIPLLLSAPDPRTRRHPQSAQRVPGRVGGHPRLGDAGGSAVGAVDDCRSAPHSRFAG